MRRTIERELKLAPGDGFQLAAFGRELPARTFVSAYHDTHDLRLARVRVTLRHRTEDGAGVWQLKIPYGAARIELEEPGPPAHPPAVLLGLLPAFLRDRELVRVARMRTRRRRVRADGAEIVEDSVAVLDGQHITARFRELEIELADGDETDLENLQAALRHAGAERTEFKPKLYRVLGLAYPWTRVELGPDSRPLDSLRVALREQHERLLAHDPGTRLGWDPEDLHQMRVGTRRARAFLRTARPILDSEWAAELRDELGWLGSALGPARDLDVLLEHVRADVSALHDGQAAQSLVTALEREHGVARKAAVEALSDERYFALLDRLEDVRPVAAGHVTTSLADLWWDEFRRTRRRFGKLGPSSHDGELHASRIQLKRARYAAELAEPELGEPGERFVTAAKRLQDVLGEHQDACVAEERIRVWAEAEPSAEPSARELVARERKRRRKARREWPDAWAKLERRAKAARP